LGDLCDDASADGVVTACRAEAVAVELIGDAEAARRDIRLIVLLDFVHVAEYRWTAAHVFHSPGSRAAETWAADELTAILAGHAECAATEMTAQVAAERLPAARRGAVTTCPATSPATSIGFTTTPPSRPAGRSPTALSKAPVVT